MPRRASRGSPKELEPGSAWTHSGSRERASSITAPWPNTVCAGSLLLPRPGFDPRRPARGDRRGRILSAVHPGCGSSPRRRRRHVRRSRLLHRVDPMGKKLGARRLAMVEPVAVRRQNGQAVRGRPRRRSIQQVDPLTHACRARQAPRSPAGMTRHRTGERPAVAAALPQNGGAPSS